MAQVTRQTRAQRLLYTLRHKVAFLRVEKRLTGGISWRGFVHDNDKVWMYLTTNKSASQVHKIHRATIRHHDNDIVKDREDYIEMILDWECARLTKPDKPLTARETMNAYYPHLKAHIEPILIELKL